MWSDASCSKKGVKQEVMFVFSLRSPTRMHKQPKDFTWEGGSGVGWETQLWVGEHFSRNIYAIPLCFESFKKRKLHLKKSGRHTKILILGGGETCHVHFFLLVHLHFLNVLHVSEKELFKHLFSKLIKVFVPLVEKRSWTRFLTDFGGKWFCRIL